MKDPKISCLPVSLYSQFFSGERTVPQWSRDAKELGLSSVDINALFLREKSLSQIAQLRKELTLPVLMVSAYSDFTLPDPQKREEAVQTAFQDMQRAAAIGAKYIRLTAGQAWPGEDDAVMCQRVYDCFARCVPVAKELGLTILLENHSKPGAWQYVDYNFHMEHFLMLWDKLKELPISINFDTANACALGDWRRILGAVAGRIATVHLNDLDSIEPLHFCLVGQGLVDMEGMLRAVYATGFDGELCIEEASFQGWEGIRLAAEYTHMLMEHITK